MALKHVERHLLIVFVFTVTVIHGASIDTINGIVTDAVSKKPVESVDISSEGVTAKTGADGKFSLLIPAADVKIKDQRVPRTSWNSVRGDLVLQGLTDDILIQVYDIAGRILKRSYFRKAESVRIPFTHWGRGILFIDIHSSSGKTVFKVTAIPETNGKIFREVTLMEGVGWSEGENTVATRNSHVVTFSKKGYHTSNITVPSGTASDSPLQVMLIPSGNSECASGLEGFATLPYGGVPSTTGGGNATPDYPVTASEFSKLAEDAVPRVIMLAKSMEIGIIKINSNKTLIGVGPGVKLTGTFHIIGSVDAYLSNIIIRNLSIQGYGWHGDPPVGLPVENAGDCVTAMYVHHLWIDHCNIYDGPDGILDVTRGSDYVTVSWCKFWFTQQEHQHRLSSLVSGGADESHRKTDSGHLNTTWHHNWWAENVMERMPRYLWGKGHIYNNYYSSAGNNYCMRIGFGAGILIENNYFHNVREPYAFYGDSANIRAEGNVEDNVKAANRASGVRGGAEPFPSPAPYQYTLHSAEQAKVLVMKCAGPQ